MGFDALLDYIVPKSWMRPKNVERLMLPLTISSWMMGMGIIECPLGNQWPNASSLYAIGLMMGFCFAMKITLDNYDFLTSRTLNSKLLILRALFYGYFFLNFSGVLLSWIRIKHIKSIVYRLEVSDEKMEKIGIPRDYKMICIRQLLSMGLQFLLVCGFIIIAINVPLPLKAVSEWYKVAFIVALYHPIIVTSLADLSFIAFVHVIALRFDRLNEFLMKMSTTSDASPQHKRVLEYTRSKTNHADGIFIRRTNDDLNAMKAVRQYHRELVQIGCKISDAFGIQVLLSMTFIFIILTALLYHTCDVLLLSSMRRPALDRELFRTLRWLGFYMLRIINVNSACAIASDKSRETESIICHLHEPSTKKAYRDEICNFSLQMTQHSLAFTACGLFTLDYGLIHTMVGTITTYLIILVQIGDMPESDIIANTTANSSVDSFRQNFLQISLGNNSA